MTGPYALTDELAFQPLVAQGRLELLERTDPYRRFSAHKIRVYRRNQPLQITRFGALPRGCTLNARMHVKVEGDYCLTIPCLTWPASVSRKYRSF